MYHTVCTHVNKTCYLLVANYTFVFLSNNGTIACDVSNNSKLVCSVSVSFAFASGITKNCSLLSVGGQRQTSNYIHMWLCMMAIYICVCLCVCASVCLRVCVWLCARVSMYLDEAIIAEQIQLPQEIEQLQ